MSDHRRYAPKTVRGALRVALAAAYDDGGLDPVLDGPLAAAALDLAAALDAVPATANPYGHARLARMYIEALKELRLTPVSRRSEVDHLTAFLADLAVPTPGTPPDAAGTG